MDKLRIAVVLDDSFPTEGGGYSYYQTLFSAIDKYSFHPDLEIINLEIFDYPRSEQQYDKPVLRVKKSFPAAASYRSLHLLYKFIHRVFRSDGKKCLEFISWLMDSITNSAAKRLLIREKIHLVYYLKPKQHLIDYPMIVTHWDVGHKSMYPFPEVAWNGNFEKREKYYQTILSRAFLILCESETGAKELQFYYPVNPDKIKVMPLFSGTLVDLNISEDAQDKILSGYQLEKDRFYLYPAQFWAHKNHSTLIKAFSRLLQEEGNESLKLVLCGGDQGNLKYISKLVQQLGLTTNIVMPGFVSNDHLNTFYKNAIALVMPTFLGPTNIPLIEAAELNCAVMCSSLNGHREILQNTALYFNASSESEIGECMRQLLIKNFREQLADSAQRRITNSSFRMEKCIALLDVFLQELKPVRAAWGAGLKLLIMLLVLAF